MADSQSHYLWGQIPADTNALAAQMAERRARLSGRASERDADDRLRLRQAEILAAQEAAQAAARRQQAAEIASFNASLTPARSATYELNRRDRVRIDQPIGSQPSVLTAAADEPDWKGQQAAAAAALRRAQEAQAREDARRAQEEAYNRQCDDDVRLAQAAKMQELEAMQAAARRQQAAIVHQEHLRQAAEAAAAQEAEAAAAAAAAAAHASAWAECQLMNPLPQHQQSAVAPHRVNPMEFKGYAGAEEAARRAQAEQAAAKAARARAEAEEAAAAAALAAEQERLLARLEYEQAQQRRASCQQVQATLESQRQVHVLTNKLGAHEAHGDVNDEFWGAFGRSRR